MSARKTGVALAPVAALALLAASCDDGGGSSSCPPPGLGACDPLDGRCCTSGEHCVVTYAGGSFSTSCLGGTPAADEGGSCQPTATSGASACAAGLVCLQVTGVDPGPVCHALCRSGADCSGTDRCGQDLSGLDGIDACVPGS